MNIFITGTDTGVGKTMITGLLARFLYDKGRPVITQKWVETGSRNVSQDIRTHDALMGTIPDPAGQYAKLRAPYVLPYAASPHLAARQAGGIINARVIKNAFCVLTRQFDHVLVEGTGGALVPYTTKRLLIDLADELNLAVIIIADNRLGAINHTLLTVEACRQRELAILGIIFTNCSSGGARLVKKENPRIISKLSGVCMLGELPYSKNLKKNYQNFQAIGEEVLQVLGLARERVDVL